MYKTIIYILFIIFIYSCAPINKQHGYKHDDILYAVDELRKINIGQSSKDDVFDILGSPSIKIEDVDDVWIYLLSIKEEKIFEKDEINYQQIFRFQFDNEGKIIKSDIYDQIHYTEIVFSNKKTTIERDAYSISDQIYDAFTRGTN